MNDWLLALAVAVALPFIIVGAMVIGFGALVLWRVATRLLWRARWPR